MNNRGISSPELPTLRVAPAATKSIDPEIAGRLAPGMVLDVTIQRKPNSQEGILIEGRFVAASVPAELEDSNEVSVQVVRTTPAIVLRVVSLDPKPLTARPATLLDEAFRILLSSEDLTTLRDSFRGLERPVGNSLNDLTTALVSNRSASKSLQEIGRHLSDSRDALRVLDDDVLKDPQRVLEALARAFASGRSETTAPKGESSQRTASKVAELLDSALVEARDIPLAQKILDRLREEITKLLTQTGRLTFGDAEVSDPERLLQSGDLMMTARSIAIAGGRSHSFAEVLPRQSARGVMDEPIIVFLRALGALSLELSRGESPLQRELGGMARQLVTTLNRVPPGAGEDADIRAALTEAAKKLDGLALRIRDQGAEASLLMTSVDINREIERVNEGQEILRALAPIARSLGEPVAMFIPAVVHGLLTKLEFTLHPPPRVDESGDESGRTDSEFFERIDLKLPLPALGLVHVAVARRPGEALINLTCETPAARAHLAELMPTLEQILDRLGYERRTVAAAVGTVPSALPEWCRNIVRSDRIA